MELWKAFSIWNNRGKEALEEYLAENFEYLTLLGMKRFAKVLSECTQNVMKEYNN